MTTVLPIESLLPNEPQVSLVDERGRLERMPVALTVEVAPGKTTKLAVNGCDEMLLSLGRARAPSRPTTRSRCRSLHAPYPPNRAREPFFPPTALNK